MRRFIYYDKEGIESYLAQITGGISLASSKEITSSQEKNEVKKESQNINLDIGGKIAGIGAGIKKDVTIGESNGQIVTNLVRSLEEKVISDYAFDKIYNYFVESNIIKGNDFKIGDVVDLNENVVFFDFDYFEKLFSEKGAYNFSINQQKKELKDLIKSLNCQQKQDTQVKKFLKETDEKIKSEEIERNYLLNIIDAARSTLPYTRFIMTEECLIVLSDNNFRDNPKNVAFKYGGKIDIVGYVTNIISRDGELASSNNNLSEIYKFVNQILLSLYNNKTKIYVIHPLAMYY